MNDLAGNGGDSTLFSQGPGEEVGEGREGGFELSDAGALPIHKWHPHTVKVIMIDISQITTPLLYPGFVVPLGPLK